jgi:hypothetical protein
MGFGKARIRNNSSPQISCLLSDAQPLQPVGSQHDIRKEWHQEPFAALLRDCEKTSRHFALAAEGLSTETISIDYIIAV